MRFSLISAAAVAALVGYGSSIAIVLAAATALGASADQTTSWVFAICLAKAIGSAGLSTWSKMPIVLAWSTPGAALIASSAGYNMAEGVGAFITAGLLIAVTGLFKPLERLITRIPAQIAAAMLGGVLLPFCLQVPTQAVSLPVLVLPIVAVFLIIRLWQPNFAVLAALGVGLALSFGGGAALPTGSVALPTLHFTAPEWSTAAILGLGLPLYLVTMASQNLPGFAVLKAAGYTPPARAALGVTGGLSVIAALFAAHPINMAAITAAICLGDDVHPDKSQRWKVGLAYAGVWLGLGIFTPVILASLAVVPPSLIATVAGLALITPLIGALGAAFDAAEGRFAAAATLIFAASGVSAFGIGGAFWGLLAGLLVHGMSRLKPA
jgi:benzoate membrane transport protein